MRLSFEEKEADERLNDLAQNLINKEAAGELKASRPEQKLRAAGLPATTADWVGSHY
jgi:hypothetical protein